jgi:hypothetical protein
MQDMPVDLSSFLNSMFKTQEVVMTKPVTREPSVLFTKDQDGIWTLSVNGKTLGWVNRVIYDAKYRAMSAITNNMETFYSLENARNYLYEQSH